MPDITPHLGDWREGRIPVTDTLWADPPELMGENFFYAIVFHIHDYTRPRFDVTYNYYGDGWHRVVVTEECFCGTVREQTWKTAVVYSTSNP